MHINKVVVENYRCLRRATVSLNSQLNILVGNNECGKSTLLEAIHLALSGHLNGRPIQLELHPYLFNVDAVKEYVDGVAAGQHVAPPSILIELYLADNPALTKLKGTINSLKEDTPGIRLSIELNADFAEEFRAYIADPEQVRTLPIEYYAMHWRSFADNDVMARVIPVKSSFIDASAMRSNSAANRYVVDILKEGLTTRQCVDLALSYRTMKDKFLSEERVANINNALKDKKGVISNKALSVSLDTSSRASWETGVMPQLDEVPLTLVGKGEQNCVKIKLALESSSASHLVLIEEPENHLSHANLSALIGQISERRGDRQLVITTHSSFVLNKLGVESVLLFNRGSCSTLRDLKEETYKYFLKLPGHDTLRLILSDRSILVEGPSDELIVQRAFEMKHGKLPLQAGVDVIAVNSLAFKRFLEIAELLKRTVDVVTDNDGNPAALQAKYADYATHPTIHVHYDEDELAKTLEPQLLKANGRDKVNQILGKGYGTDDDLLKFMAANKTECALRFFETPMTWEVPEYVRHAVG